MWENLLSAVLRLHIVQSIAMKSRFSRCMRIKQMLNLSCVHLSMGLHKLLPLLPCCWVVCIDNEVAIVGMRRRSEMLLISEIEIKSLLGLGCV